MLPRGRNSLGNRVKWRRLCVVGSGGRRKLIGIGAAFLTIRKSGGSKNSVATHLPLSFHFNFSFPTHHLTILIHLYFQTHNSITKQTSFSSYLIFSAVLIWVVYMEKANSYFTPASSYFFLILTNTLYDFGGNLIFFFPKW